MGFWGVPEGGGPRPGLGGQGLARRSFWMILNAVSCTLDARLCFGSGVGILVKLGAPSERFGVDV